MGEFDNKNIENSYASQQYDQWMNLTGFMLLGMVGLSLYGFFNTFTMLLSTGDIQALYAPIMIPRYVELALLIMVTIGVFKRDEFWGLWAGCLLALYIVVHRYAILPVHLDLPVISFHFTPMWFIFTLFPLVLLFFLLKPIIFNRETTLGTAIGTIWRRVEGSKFFFALLCLAVFLPSLALLYPSIIGKILAVLGALVLLDSIGPTKVVARGHTQAEAASNLSKEIQKTEDMRTTVFFIALGMIVYGLWLIESAG